MSYGDFTDKPADVGPPMPAKTSGQAIASLVLGIMSIVVCLSCLTGVPAVILGFLGMRSIDRSGGRIVGSGMAIAGLVLGLVGSVITVPILIALLLPAVQAARGAARRMPSMNNLKQIGMGLMMHETMNGQFPAAGTTEPVAGPGAPRQGANLSWRVHILPLLEEDALYEKFHLDEPWDSPHNLQLAERMPSIYRSPRAETADNETVYLAVRGPGTVFGDGTMEPHVAQISDGASMTVFVVEVDESEAVLWTKPQDWEFDPNEPTQGLASHLSSFLALFGDGHVQGIYPDAMDEASLRALFTASAGDVVEWPFNEFD